MQRTKVLLLVVGVIAGLLVGYQVSNQLTAGRISSLKSELGAERAKVANLEDQLSKAEKKISALSEAKSELETQLSDVEEELNAKSAQLEEVKSELEAKSAQLERTKSELESARREVEQLNNAVTKAKERIRELEEELAHLRELREAVTEAGLGGIELSNPVFYLTEPPEGEVNPTGIYKPGQTVWVYAELRGFRLGEVDDKYAVHVIWRLEVYDILGSLVLSIPEEHYDEFEEPPEYVWFKAQFSAFSEPGAYIVVLTAYDKVSLRCVTKVSTFLVEVEEVPPPPP